MRCQYRSRDGAQVIEALGKSSALRRAGQAATRAPMRKSTAATRRRQVMWSFLVGDDIIHTADCVFREHVHLRGIAQQGPQAVVPRADRCRS